MLAITLDVPLTATRQSAGSIVTGVVTDQMGGLVPGAKVVLIDHQAKEKGKTRTDKAGRYRLKPVPSGPYTLEIQQPGFRLSKHAVQLTEGDVVSDVRLEVGDLWETVHVGLADVAARNEPPIPAPKFTCKDPLSPGGVGGHIQPPMKLRHVWPAYPRALRTAGVSGRVVLRGVVGIDGTLKQLLVERATNEEFAKAAFAAVGQWRYSPTRLNCTPIELNTTTQIDFGDVRNGDGGGE